MCNNAPDLTRTALDTRFGNSQKHPPAVRCPFSRKDRGSRPAFCIQSLPDSLCVRVLFVCYVLVVQLAVKLLFVRQHCLTESPPRVHVLVRVDPLFVKKFAAFCNC